MRKRNKLKNIEQANMMLEQSYLKSKAKPINEIEIIEETWKEWVTAGLLTLSSIAGFYKLDKNAEENTQLINQIETTVDKMKPDQIYDLVDDYNSTEHGVTTPSIDIGVRGSSVKDVTNLEDTFGKDSIAGGKTYVIDIIKNNLKNQIKRNPEQFLISKDGKTVKLNPELEKTIGKWGNKGHHTKDMYKSK